MYCIKCGKQIDDNVKFCKYCGAKAYEGTTATGTLTEATPTTTTLEVIEKPIIKKDAKSGDGKPVKKVEKSSPKKKSHALIIVVASILILLMIIVGAGFAYMIINDLMFDYNKLMEGENPFVSISIDAGEDIDDDDYGENDVDTITFTDGDKLEQSDETANETTSEDSDEVAKDVAVGEEAADSSAIAEDEQKLVDDGKNIDDKWPEAMRGSYYNCADKMPFGIDENVWTMTVDDFESYTGIKMLAHKDDETKFSFSNMATEAKGVEISDDSYLVIDSDGKIAMLHFEYASDFENDLKKVVELDKKIISAVSADCINTGEYIYYGSLPIISYSLWEGTDYRANVYEEKITYCRENYYIADNNSKEEFAKEYDEISSQIAALDKADRKKDLKIDIEKECAKIDKQRIEIQDNLESYKYYENGLVSWYLKDKVPVYIHAMVGYHDVDYDRIFMGNDISYAQVIENGIKDEYYFNGNQLIRVVDCFGEVHDYGSRQWDRYSDKAGIIINERERFKVTIDMAMEQLQ